MERMGHSQIMTTRKYLHTLPDADDTALPAFESVRHRASTSLPRRQRHGRNRLRERRTPGPTALEITELPHHRPWPLGGSDRRNPLWEFDLGPWITL